MRRMDFTEILGNDLIDYSVASISSASRRICHQVRNQMFSLRPYILILNLLQLNLNKYNIIQAIILLLRNIQGGFMHQNRNELIVVPSQQYFLAETQKMVQLEYDFLKMSNNMIVCTHHLASAYRLAQQGQLQQSIEQYEKAVKNTYNQSLKNNIKCTIAILQYHQTKQSSQQALQSIILSQSTQPTNLVTIRAIINCILIDILQSRCSRASQYFQTLIEIVNTEGCLHQRRNLVEYMTYLLFRVRNFEEIPEYIQSMDISGLKVEQIYSISLMAFNSQLCGLQSQQKIQKKCLSQFMKLKRYDLAIFSLRALVKFSKNNLPMREYYEKQLAKLIMLGYFSPDVDFQNFDAFDLLQDIVEKFVRFRASINEQIAKLQMRNTINDKSTTKPAESTDAQLRIQWKYSLQLMRKQVNKNKELDNNHKATISSMLQSIKNEDNILVIRSMIKNNYFCKYHQKVKTVLHSLAYPIQKVNQVLKDVFSYLKIRQKQDNILKQNKHQKSRLSLKSERSRSYKPKPSLVTEKDIAEDKQNTHPLGISIVSIASSKVSKEGKQVKLRNRIFNNSLDHAAKKIQKMIKVCEYGTFLNKRNFNSEGGQYRFVKITNSFIKWGKDPEKIQTSCQIYPLKDIKSIVYGRVSPNLNQSCNKMLVYSRCFSLLLQKRTLDFYCKNYEQLEAWVCGLTSVLKKQQNKVVGYTPGKLRWKKMFAILREKFIEPLKYTEKNKYYYQNAYSLILFARNGYKLPNSNDKK